ncbi:unnamed protein product [Prunus armeniaca]|uniref:Bulb-type lectin domain-containing protein n=1 Tax=Prunus armeniaca TaxID=36596 RepID=A0A6J5X1R1_PRUAR|nr:unnamed protein product [Prunus armeniaca]
MKVPEKPITANQTLTSSSGSFALGFFSPPNSTRYFLGIWYNTIPKTESIAWVANRASPLDSPGIFALSADGNLVVLDGITRKLVIRSSNASVPASAMNATSAELLDSGNLQLRHGEDTLWQSFDHPSDTLLPGMRLCVNKRTGYQMRLTSWAALEDPQPGKFTLGFDPKVAPGQVFIWKENATYWRSIICIGKKTQTTFGNLGGLS